MEVSKLLEFICNSCQGYVNQPLSHCPYCQTPLIFAGQDKNVTDSLTPNCLIHRYQGSDLLEPALLLKEGKTNMKVAVKLKDVVKPITVPKVEVFKNDDNVLNEINRLRLERKLQMEKYDETISDYWQKLQNYTEL